MQLRGLLPVLTALLVAPAVFASANSPDTSSPPSSSSPYLSPEQLASVQGSENHAYQSDIARLLKVVVSHLYNDKDVFVRELLSNANDAVEKLRFLSLTDANILSGAQDLNVTVQVDKPNKRIIFRDTGIGMTKEQLSKNLGTIARSGTSEFVQQLESSSSPPHPSLNNNSSASLIGQFGLGFYSSFLVASKVTVASKSFETDAKQYVFESEADAEGFKIYQDPRGDTLVRGTEITLWLKPGEQDVEEFLEEGKLRELIERHAAFNSAPIYLWQGDETTVDSTDVDTSDGEIKVNEGEGEKGGWKLINDQAPLWMRDPKEVTGEEYEAFYMKTFKESKAQTALSHFTGDIGSTTFKALVYLPATVPADFYSKDYVSLEALKLFVRRVFITGDLGKDYLPRWLNWVKVFVDVEDLPLNVGRDSLQKTKSLGRIKKNLVKRIYDLLIKVSQDEPAKYLELYKSGAGTALKIGAVEEKDPKQKEKILKLLRFETSASEDEMTSLDQVVERRKEKQEQIYFVAGAGQTKKDLEKSPFVERILARGYEVLYFTEPIDEMLASGVGTFKNMRFVDCAKDGVKFGDEDDEDKEEELKESFKPLVDYLKKELAAHVDKVDISTRLVASPCMVTASTYGYSANMERLMAAQNAAAGGSDNFMLNFAKQQKKNFELNAKHPLIERLLEKVEDAEHDEDAEKELKETIQVLWQTALLKSSYTIPDPSQYFSMIETILRKSLGVSQTAKAQIEVKPAPAIATTPLEAPAAPAMDIPSFFDQQEEQGEAGEAAHSWADWKDVKEKIANVGETIGKVLPDLGDDAGHEEILHEEL